MNKWRTRTIRNGRVKIDGEWFYPDEHHRPYNGELDGGKYVFGRYWAGGKWLPYVCLWGSEEYAKAGAMAATEDELLAEMDKVAHTNKNIIDGYIYWESWRTRTSGNPA